MVLVRHRLVLGSWLGLVELSRRLGSLVLVQLGCSLGRSVESSLVRMQPRCCCKTLARLGCCSNHRAMRCRLLNFN